MACYQVTRFTTMQFNLKQKEILIQVLEEMDFKLLITTDKISFGNVLFDLKNEKAIFPDYFANKFKLIKQKYSERVVEIVAKKRNWRLKKIASNKFKATKF